MKSRMFRMLQLFAEETVDHTAEPDAVKDSVNPENTSDDSGEEKKVHRQGCGCDCKQKIRKMEN